MSMADDQTVVLAAVAAIRTGDLDELQRLIDARPDLVRTHVNGRSALHVVADWPGYFPNGPQVVRLLVAAGADPNFRLPGGETPLHWAASSDDVDVAEALIDAGADIETPDGSIGTPLDNAIGYGCWHVARLLVQRGARVDKLWHAAALGLMARLEELLAAEIGSDSGSESGAGKEEIDKAFWQACHGGQRRAAELLLRHGADINAVQPYAHGTPLDAAAGTDTRRSTLVDWLRGHGAESGDAHDPRDAPES
jgi:ankyrin repeat protein